MKYFIKNFSWSLLCERIPQKIHKFIRAFPPRGLSVTTTSAQDQQAIKDMLLSKQPCMICRFGSTELSILASYLRWKTKNPFKKLYYIRRDAGADSYPTRKWHMVFKRMVKESGIFPPTKETIVGFSQRLLSILPDIDMLASFSFLLAERHLYERYFSYANIIAPRSFEAPIHGKKSWSEALEDKKVLVIHPFERSIKSQYKKRHLLFSDPRVLPEFELKTLKAVQSLGVHCSKTCGYATWFDALDAMCHKINEIDFDIALIGAGGYGIFLAQHVKSIGKKAVHIGGATQLLFGIKGNRWTNTDIGKNIYNEHWVHPDEHETPINFRDIGDHDHPYW